jgi:hypothetical protein
MEWLAVIIGTFAVLVAVFLRGASSGQDSAELEALHDVEKAKQIDVPVDTNAVRDRLRDSLRK